VREGLLLALAEQREPAAAPVFASLFASTNDAIVLRGAAVGLGMLGGPRQRALLIGALSSAPPRRIAALWGLRHVRHPDAVEAVALILEHAADEATLLAAARALGYLGSSWAWQTGRAGPPEDEARVRRRCADALWSAFRKRNGSVREQAARSLCMVQHPSTVERIDERIRSLEEGAERSALVALRRRILRSAR